MSDTDPQPIEAPSEPPRRSFSGRMVGGALALGLLGGLLGGAAVGAMQEGPSGGRGARGAQGEKGDAGPAGTAANVDQLLDDLGICYSIDTNYSNTVYVRNVYLTSPVIKANGTNFCPSGDFLSVKPQKQGAGG
jgi:hypothetical protein